MPPCPEWCSLPAGHGWDTEHGDGCESRGHQGPVFGVHVSAGAQEFRTAIGIHVYDITIASEVERDVVTSMHAVALAGHLLDAAQWVTTHQMAPSRRRGG